MVTSSNILYSSQHHYYLSISCFIYPRRAQHMTLTPFCQYKRDVRGSRSHAVAIESDYSSVATGSLWEQALLLFPDIYNVNHFPPLSGLTASNLISSDFLFLCRFISVLFFRRGWFYMSKVQNQRLHDQLFILLVSYKSRILFVYDVSHVWA